MAVGDPARVEVLCEAGAHLPMVMSRWVAARMPPHVTAEDLAPAAWDGLYQAAASWDETAGLEFPRWAKRRIYGEIRDHLRKEDTVPRAVRQHIREFHAASDRLTADLGRAPTREETAEAAGLAPGVMLRSLAEAATVGVAPERLENPTARAIPSSEPGPAEAAAAGEARTWVRAAVAALPDRQRHVLASIYWLDTPNNVLAGDLGVSESRVSQIHTEALTAVRDALAFHIQGDPGKPLTGAMEQRRSAYRLWVEWHYRRLAAKAGAA